MSEKKKKIVIITAVVLAVILLLFSIFHKKPEAVFTCAVVNGFLNDSEKTLSTDLTEYFGLDNKKEYAYIDKAYQIAYDGCDNKIADYSNYDKFFLNIRYQMLDAAIVPESFAEYLYNLGEILVDPTEIMSDAYSQKYGEYEVYYKNHCIGLDVTESGFLNGQDFMATQCNEDETYVLIFISGSKGSEKRLRFIDYLF